jgi:hypothetical protein
MLLTVTLDRKEKAWEYPHGTESRRRTTILLVSSLEMSIGEDWVRYLLPTEAFVRREPQLSIFRDSSPPSDNGASR